MSEIAIITDSTASIPTEYLEKYSIQVAPQVVIWGEETLYDDIDITTQQFYARLVTSDVLPTTSQATVASFLDLFQPHVDRGTPILGIFISDLLSGTIQSAEQAKAQFPGATIEIFNSKSAAMHLGFQVLAAARAIEAGGGMEAARAAAQQAKDNSGVIFVVDTLEYLHKGGRIGGAARLFGTALSLKPVLHVYEGRIEPLERVRTKAKATARLLDLIAEHVEGKENIRVSSLHAAAPDEALTLKEKVMERVNAVEHISSVVGPAIGTHVGPGTVGIAYCTGI
jgi:DegV family protein with EDD domain